MAILPTDVKLYESQRLTDEDDGGGLATGNVVEDGQVNNLFPDISRLDRTIGDVALRKCFVGIDTANPDVYLGAHTIITKKPTDPLVSALLFETGNPNDERSAAQSQIESYVVRGARANWFILGNQYVGQRLVIGFQDPTQDMPEVGEVFELWEPGETFNQFVRVTTVEAEIETFASEQGNSFVYIDKRKLTLGISSPLENTYIGGVPSPGGTTGPSTTVNTTEVADAAKYYGVSDLEVVGAPGDLVVEVDSVYSHLVPSAQSESVFADQPGAFNRGLYTESRVGTISESSTVNYIDSTLTLYAIRPIMPGTAVVTLSGAVYLDNGQGVAEHSSGSDLYNVSINYGLGIIACARKTTVSGNGNVAVVYTPCAALIGQAETGTIDVTLQNRAFNWTLALADSKPRPGTLVASFMALGKWQTIYDLGDGELGGQGSGTINFATGTVIITMPVMPDAGTAIVYSYISNVDGEFEAVTGVVAQKVKHELQLLAGVKPGSIVLSWNSGAAKTATDDGKGIISGDATGRCAYATGEVIFEPTTLIDNNTVITTDYEQAVPLLESFGLGSDAQGVTDMTIAGAPILPGSIVIQLNVNQRQKLIRSSNPDEISWADKATEQKIIQDDGIGGFVNGKTGEAISGSVNYVTGEISVTTARDVAIPAIVGQQKPGGFLNRSYTTKSIFGTEFIRQAIEGAINVYFQPDSVTVGVQQQLDTITDLKLDLISDPNGIAPGSLWFEFDGEQYIDSNGILEKGKSAATGAATAVGTIDYQTGEIELTVWPDGAAQSVEIKTCVTQNAAMATSIITFRTPGRPLRPGSMQITAVRQDDSTIISATADADGTITHAELTGFVNTETGLVQLWFTTDPDDDTGDSDIPVYPGSVRYNAVSYSFLPLDADLIGVDPVRLPADGRVPIFRDGDVIVVAHEQISAIGSPAAGEVFTLPRAFLAYCLVIDANDVAMDPSEYVNDLDAGTITFANPVTFVDADSNALTLPLRAIERVEHMTVVSDAQVSGSLSMISPLPHDYPLGSTVSSALLFGDINARVYHEFTQKSWNSSSPNWTDNRIGDDTTASYNLVDSPIVVNNNGAISENWAIVFTGSTSFNIVGEQVGIIGTGTIGTDTAPINLNTGNPYFVLLAAGWGAGWTSGNVLRFDTDGCLAPIWMSRTVLSGKGTADDDSVTLQIRGDAD